MSSAACRGALRPGSRSPAGGPPRVTSAGYPLVELLLRADTGTFTAPDPFTLTEPGVLTEISDPPVDGLELAEVELFPETLPLLEALLAAETGTLTELGRVAETSDPPVARLACLREAPRVPGRSPEPRQCGIAVVPATAMWHCRGSAPRCGMGCGSCGVRAQALACARVRRRSRRGPGCCVFPARPASRHLSRAAEEGRPGGRAGSAAPGAPGRYRPIRGTRTPRTPRDPGRPRHQSRTAM